MIQFISHHRSESRSPDKGQSWFNPISLNTVVPVIKIGRYQLVFIFFAYQFKQERTGEVPSSPYIPITDPPAFIAVGQESFIVVPDIIHIHAPNTAETVERK